MPTSTENSEKNFPEIETDGGFQTVIYTTKAGLKRPIHGAIWFGDNYEWVPCSWTEQGYRISEGNQCDLNITKAVADGQIQDK